MATKVTSDLPNFSSRILTALNNSIQEVGFKVEQNAKENAPVNTGHYRDQIIFDGRNTITANADYSAPLEYGISNPVIIKPKQAKALRFTVNGQEVFAKYVQQKTRQPNPIMRLAARNVQRQVDSIFKKNFARIK